MEQYTVNTPWANSVGNVPMHLKYFDGTMFEAVQAAAEKYPHYSALNFMGKRTSYQELVSHITSATIPTSPLSSFPPYLIRSPNPSKQVIS